jgi:hypothetical protein
MVLDIFIILLLYMSCGHPGHTYRKCLVFFGKLVMTSSVSDELVHRLVKCFVLAIYNCKLA